MKIVFAFAAFVITTLSGVMSENLTYTPDQAYTDAPPYSDAPSYTEDPVYTEAPPYTEGTAAPYSEGSWAEAPVQAPAVCATPPWGYCGNDYGIMCCPRYYYCQPWNSAYYQCMLTPTKCAKQYTNIEFYGCTIKTIYGIQPSDCCEACATTSGCKGYTFVNSYPGSPVCYLKSAKHQRARVGAVSGVLT